MRLTMTSIWWMTRWVMRKTLQLLNGTVKVNPFRHTCEESTLRKETISRAKSRWVAKEVKRWVTENHQVGAKELQKNIKDKSKIELPYMRVFNGKQQAMDSIYANWQESFELLYSFEAEVERTSPVDPAFGESFDENVDTNEDQNVDQNEEENVDPNEDDPNYDPNEAPNDDPNEAPNDGGQPSMVASSASSVVVSKNKVKVPTPKRR
ncbi:hypothetical protein ACQ4PT_069551 [Festuca glaucescens]